MSELTLAIDTSAVVSVALARGAAVLADALVDDPRAHAEQVMPLVDEVCAQAGVAPSEITRVAVGVGPGPFTGLRVGIVTARTLAFLAGVEPIGVCSLDIVARQWVESPASALQPRDEFVALIDARRKEVYWAHYRADGGRVGEVRVTSPSEVPNLPCVGPGTSVLGADPRVVTGGPQVVDAGVLASRVETFAPAGIEPLYLRKPDATEPGARKTTLVRARPRR